MRNAEEGKVGWALLLGIGNLDSDLIGAVSPARMQLRRPTVIQNIMKPFEQEKQGIKRDRSHQDVREEKRPVELCQGVFPLSTRQ